MEQEFYTPGSVAGSYRGQRRSQDLREAALTLFAERGYRGTTVRDIAQELGIQGPSLYNHMHSKQEILRDIMFSTTEQAFAAQRVAIAGVDERNGWPTIADAFGMEVGENKPMSLADEMPEHQREWEEIVRGFDLQATTDLKEFIGQSGIYADFCLGYGLEKPPPMLSSTIKIRQAGFQDCMDTEDMFRKWITHFQQERLLPPVTVRSSPT